MSRYIEGEQRTQSVLFPEQLEDWITEDNPVRAVDAFVDELNLTELGFAGAQPAGTGRPAYHPATLLKIYIYGYLNRIQSSRRLEREAQRNVELVWLTGRLMPDFKTIADFRKDNGEAIRRVCRKFVELSRQVGLFTEGVVAIDGSKFKAVNNRDKNFTPHKLQARMKQLEESIARYLDDLDRADREAAAVPPARVSQLKEKIAAVKAQVRKLRKIERQMLQTPDQQVSLTDPDARSMATSGRGTGMVGYNVQTVVDTQHHMIVAHEVTNVGHDRTQLTVMSKLARDTLGQAKMTVLADRGYFNGQEILQCAEEGIAPLVPKPLTSNSKAEGRFDKRDFIYDPKRDEYRCPAGERAIWRMTTVEKGLTLHRYWPSACPRCPIKSQCTPSPQRRITRWEHEQVPYVGGMLRLIRAFGLRKREAIMFRPNECVANFADTGLPLAEKQGEEYVWIRQGAKGGRPRFVPMNTPRRRDAVASAQRIAFWDSHAHTGDPDRDLKQNMVRFGYVLRKFGITSRGLGITAHGLRHEALIEEYIAITGQEPPLRGGGEGLTREQEEAARLAVSRLAGHNRGRASAAFWAPCCTRRRAAEEAVRWVGTLRLDVVVRPVVHRPFGWRRQGAAVRRGCAAASVVWIEKS